MGNCYLEIWRTLYEDEFNPNVYLYHYTSISSAAKILYYKSLKFSKLTKMNDTLESKPKISQNHTSDSESIADIVQYFKNTNDTKLQLLCMSRDFSNSRTEVDEQIKYSDFSGRAFALPRMWAQYASNNSGVCLIFDKEKLIQLIKDTLGSALIHADNVKYISKFKSFEISPEAVQSFSNYLVYNSNKLFRDINALSFLKNNIEFVKYNYFSKLEDWQGEREFRFLAYGDEEYYINHIIDALVGIVVGEHIEKSDLSFIRYLCPNNCDIMKINFNFTGCTLKNTEEEK